MKKIKDFFHNNNDIILAFVIIVLAIGVIYWRLAVILDYPKQHVLDSSAKTESSLDVSEDKTDAKAADDASVAKAASDASDTDNKNDKN